MPPRTRIALAATTVAVLGINSLVGVLPQAAADPCSGAAAGAMPPQASPSVLGGNGGEAPSGHRPANANNNAPLPKLGKLVAGDDASYRYLAESIRMHPDQATLKAMMKTVGFGHVDVHNLTGGVVALHVGIKC